MPVLCMFIVGVIILIATVRTRCVVKRFGVFLASIGHVNPHSSAACYALLQKPCVFEKLQKVDVKVVVQLGSIIPNTSAVYVHCCCAIVEHDGSDSMFC